MYICIYYTTVVYRDLVPKVMPDLYHQQKADAQGPKYYMCNGFWDTCHHIWVLGPSGFGAKDWLGWLQEINLSPLEAKKDLNRHKHRGIHKELPLCWVAVEAPQIKFHVRDANTK